MPNEPVRSKELAIAILRTVTPNKYGMIKVRRIIAVPKKWYHPLLRLVGRNPNEKITYEPQR
jgi:hypothetical protein